MTGELGEAELLAVAYAPGHLRARYRALLSLDAVLRRIAIDAREPLPAQLKLAWWREACARPPEGREHPVLGALADSWAGGNGTLVGLVDGWEAVVAADRFAEAAEAVAKGRAMAFAACTDVDDSVTREAARVWTLVTLAERAPDAEEREQMRAAARRIPARVLPRALRPLTVLEGLARRALGSGRGELIGDRWSPLAAMRLGIFGR